MKKKQSTLLLLVPLAVSAVIVLLNIFTPFEAVERRVYDVLLHVRPAVPEHPAIEQFVDTEGRLHVRTRPSP